MRFEIGSLEISDCGHVLSLLRSTWNGIKSTLCKYFKQSHFHSTQLHLQFLSILAWIILTASIVCLKTVFQIIQPQKPKPCLHAHANFVHWIKTFLNMRFKISSFEISDGGHVLSLLWSTWNGIKLTLGKYFKQSHFQEISQAVLFPQRYNK